MCLQLASNKHGINAETKQVTMQLKQIEQRRNSCRFAYSYCSGIHLVSRASMDQKYCLIGCHLVNGKISKCNCELYTSPIEE